MDTLTSILATVVINAVFASQVWASGCPVGAHMVGETPPIAMTRGCVRVDQYGERIRHGYWTEFYLNGQMQQEGFYEDGERVGSWMWWYANGIKMQEGAFVQGTPVGEWSFWNVRGGRIPAPGGISKKSQTQFSEFANHVTRAFSRSK